ncbi:uncharacterized protein [Equus przewalskii]|uniref:Uncharacterized protein n=1 Tax=Equus przewalskii TaxID=9798 RepID=A0ABM4LZA6_EQUPR
MDSDLKRATDKSTIKQFRMEVQTEAKTSNEEETIFIKKHCPSPWPEVSSESDPCREGPLPKEVQKRKLCALRGRGAGLADAGMCSSGPAGAGCPSQAQGKPQARRGEDTGGGPGQLRGLTWSCWLRAAAATASRAATSTLLQRLRAPPRPRSPRPPQPPPPGGQFNPAELRPPPRGCPWSLPPPGPRAASPVHSEEVEESERLAL